MRLLILLFSITIFLFSCSNETIHNENTAAENSAASATDDISTALSNDSDPTTGAPTLDIGDCNYTAYNVFIEDNDTIYKPNDIICFQVMKSDTVTTIISKNIHGADIACIKDNNGNYYAAISGNKDSDHYNCFYQIGDSEYPYSNTIEIFEYNGVLNHSGFIFSFGTGADTKSILYFYTKEDIPILLAECDKSNYEIYSDDEDNRKLITTSGSIISETIIYYNIIDKIYKFNMNSFIYNLLFTDNEIVSVIYDDTEDKFSINVCSKNNLTVVSSMEAYIDGNTLYIKTK
jgi:hypothetical protein